MAFPDSPIISDLFEPGPSPDADGLIDVPRAPGLGYSLNERVVEKYRVKPF